MKAAAAEAGFDPVLVERAARLVPASASAPFFQRLIGGPMRLDQEASFPRELDEEAAARLLSAVRLRAGARHPGTGESTAVGMSWHASGEGSSVLVNAHSEAGSTRVGVTVDRSSGLFLTSLGTIVGVFASFLAAIAAAQETAISPYLVLGTGVAGSLALARAYWTASTRRFRAELGDLMDTIQRSLGGARGEPPPTREPLPKANLAEKLSRITEHWSPRLAARVNDTDVELVKLQGELVWHHHEDDDALFLVVKGRLLMQFRDREEWVEEGELIVVPRGVEHRPVAHEEVHVLLMGRASTSTTAVSR